MPPLHSLVVGSCSMGTTDMPAPRQAQGRPPCLSLALESPGPARLTTGPPSWRQGSLLRGIRSTTYRAVRAFSGSRRAAGRPMKAGMELRPRHSGGRSSPGVKAGAGKGLYLPHLILRSSGCVDPGTGRGGNAQAPAIYASQTAVTAPRQVPGKDGAPQRSLIPPACTTGTTGGGKEQRSGPQSSSISGGTTMSTAMGRWSENSAMNTRGRCGVSP